MAKLMETIPLKVKAAMGIIVQVNAHIHNNLDYLEIVVEKYPFPVSYKGKYYSRSGSTLLELTGHELDKLVLSLQGRTWDSVPVPTEKVGDLKNDALAAFRTKAVHSGRLDEESVQVSNEVLIKNLRLFDGEHLTRAAILAFHSDPEKWFCGAYIKIGFFETEADIRFQDDIHGPLLEQVDKTIDLMYSKYLKGIISYEGIQRVETFMFPRLAFRELLLNAVVHKDYSAGFPIQIRVYKDKIRIWNDGKLPAEITPELLYKEHVSKPHNPRLADIFFKCGMIESWGRGYEKITAACAAEQTPLPHIDTNGGGITIRCFSSQKYTERASAEFTLSNDRVNDRVNIPDENENKVKILELMAQNPKITVKQMEQTLTLSERYIRKLIAELKKQNKIKRVGAAKNGRWHIPDRK